MRQKRILLAFVKTMYFIHKQHGTTIRQTVLFCPFNGFTDFFHPAGYGRKPFHFGINAVGNNFRQRGFSRPRRSPKDHGMNMPGFNGFAQRFALPDQMSLTAILFQCGRAHSRRQRAKITCSKIEAEIRHKLPYFFLPLR